jgi:spermidine/putrescine transport system ATP-binding protein
VGATFFGTHLRAQMAPLAAPDLVLTIHLPQGTAVMPGDTMPLFARDPVLL